MCDSKWLKLPNSSWADFLNSKCIPYLDEPVWHDWKGSSPWWSSSSSPPLGICIGNLKAQTQCVDLKYIRSTKNAARTKMRRFQIQKLWKGCSQLAASQETIIYCIRGWTILLGRVQNSDANFKKQITRTHTKTRQTLASAGSRRSAIFWVSATCLRLSHQFIRQWSSISHKVIRRKAEDHDMHPSFVSFSKNKLPIHT